MKRGQTSDASSPHVVSDATVPGAAGVGEREEGLGLPAQESIARRAYELYLERGAEAGRDLEDWFRAEADLGGGRQ